MGKLSDNQRRILEVLAAEHGWWARGRAVSELLGDVGPAAVGMALKGLYKRGLVDRRPPAPKDSAAYRINAAGQEQVKRWQRTRTE